MTNGRMQRTLTFDVGDAPMILHALRIGAVTAMMCGHDGAKKRMDRYVAMVREVCDPQALLFEEEEFSEMCAALAAATEYEVVLENPRWVGAHWRSGKSIAVKVGGRTYFSKDHGFTADSAEFSAVRRLMAELAPLGVTELETTA